MKTPRQPLRVVRNPRVGFTLLELISVIAICGILAALIIPVVGRMRLSGKKVATANNMRQLGIAVLAYANENQNRLPGPTSQGLFTGYTKNTQNQLSHMLAPYLGLPEQASLAAGQSVVVPQLLDPGYLTFNRNPPSSVPHYVQKIAYPAWRADLSGRRPFGAMEASTESRRRPLGIFEFAQLPPEQRWLLTTVDQQVAGLTGSWKSMIPKKPLYGDRFRLYIDGSVSTVKANDTN